MAGIAWGADFGLLSYSSAGEPGACRFETIAPCKRLNARMDFFTPDAMTLGSAAWRMAFATALPFLIGLERFLRKKPIDFRPFVIISVGACGLVIASIEMLHTVNDTQTQIDPTRVIEGVITGIGFLGAGAMFREGNFVQGAGSAAAIWVAGAIGLICGMGEVWLATVIATIVLILLVASAPFTSKWNPEDSDSE